MRHLVKRLLIPTILVLMVALPGVFLAQDNPAISVTPSTGVVGSGVFQVNVSGLTPDNTYTIEFVIDGLVVFASDEQANADGNIIFSAASTEDDAPGTYTVQVINNNSIIASTDFELTVGDDTEPEADDTDDTTDETPVDVIGSLSVTPPSGPISTVHTIRIRELDPDTPYTVEITASATEEVVYRRLWSTDDTGGIDIDVFAEDDDIPGQQVIRVFDNMGNVVAQGEFTVNPPPERNAIIDIVPQAGQAGRTFTITVSGLAQFDSVSLQITSDNNALIDTILARASSEGVATLTFLSDDELEEGTYNVTLFVDGEQLGETTLTIGDAPPPTETEEETPTEAPTEDSADDEAPTTLPAVMTVDPEVGLLGETHVITVTSLEAGQAITFTIFNRAGEIEFSTTRMADDNGEFTINIASSEDDDLGMYPIEVTDATSGQLLASGAIVIAEMQSSPEDDTEDTSTDDTQQAGDASISVNPVSGDIGATHTITLSNMPVEERIGVTIRNAADGTLAQSSVVAIDDNGNGTLDFTSREINNPGDYTVTVVLPDGQRVVATLTVEGAIVTIDPQSGVIGTNHTVTVTGLNANETITFNVMFNGETVFSTEENSDDTGVATLTLATEESDEPGDYTVMVERESGNEPSAILTVTLEEVAEETEETAEEETAEETTEETTDETAEDATEETAEDVVELRPVEIYEETLPTSGTASIAFSGNEGEFVIITVESDEFDPAAAVFNDNFFEIAYNDDALGTTDSLLGPLQLPYTGAYSLDVFSALFDDDAIGSSFTVTITPIHVPTVAFNEPIDFSLTADMPTAYFAVEASAGDSLDIIGNTSGTLDTVLRVLNSGGLEIGFDDDGGAGFEAEINNLLLELEDTYLVEISTFSSDIEGQGTLTIVRNPVKSLDDGSAIVELNDKQFRDLVVLDAFEGELVTINLEKLSGSVEDLYVFATVDGMQVMSYTTMGVPTNLPLTFVMPMDGTVVITLEEFGFGSGITFNVTATKSRRN